MQGGHYPEGSGQDEDWEERNQGALKQVQDDGYTEMLILRIIKNTEQ